jgi:Aerobic-type carbon monoxide dehydrogenase, middle subunit CoxM/CutM homologs
MKSFANTNARDVAHALTLVRQAKQDGRSAAIAGGGSDLLGLMKERLVTPDVMVSLKSIKGLDQIKEERSGITIGALTTLDTIANHPVINGKYAVLAEAANGVATPQIRNVATLQATCCSVHGAGTTATDSSA